MHKNDKTIPAHKRMAMGGSPFKKGGRVKSSHEKAESAAYEAKEERAAKGYKKGGAVKKKGCK